MRKKSILYTLLSIIIVLGTTCSASAAVFYVTTTTGTGAGSIDAAITAANGNGMGKDTIYFNIPGAGPHTINLAITLQAINGSILIDADSMQTGYDPLNPKPVVEIINTAGTTFQVIGGVCEIRSLAFNSTITGHGILLNSAGNKITGCYFGLGLDGITDKGNQFHGILINSSNNIIGGTTIAERNIISGNGEHGIQLNGGSNNYIIGNYIGISSNGLIEVGNNIEGINLNGGSNNHIGGFGDSSNVIGGNNLFGIEINGSSNNYIVGNYNGISSDSTTNIGNRNHGLVITNGSSNRVYANLICYNGTNDVLAAGVHGIVITNNSNSNLIGNTGRKFRNIISGNLVHGIDISNSTGTILKSNFLGIGPNGITAMGNGSIGINVTASIATIIGGSHTTEGNIISSNLVHGAEITGNSKKCIIKGNYFGTDSTGTGDFGNNVIGLVIKSDSCTVGSIVAGEENIIGSSGLAGLLVANSNRNLIEGNFIGVGSDLSAIPNEGDGFIIAVEDAGYTASNNIFNHNIVAYNEGNGINVGNALNNFNNTNELNNILRFNSIYCNQQLGISLALTNTATRGNNGKIAPAINNALSTSSKVVGLANGLLPTDQIDIYEMSECINCDQNPQGKRFINSVSPDAAGNWNYDNGSPITGTIIAMATDAQGNSSQFSLCFTPCEAKASIEGSNEYTAMLESGQPFTVNLTSNSTFSNLTPEPGRIFWSLNTADTIAPAFISSTSPLTLTFQAGASGTSYEPGLYTVYLIAKQSGCMDTTQIRVNAFFIPNMITPNGDEHNDRWQVGSSPGQFDAKIFNRWGDLVYSKSDYTDEWDGTGLGDGVYYYLLEDKIQSGKSYKGWVEIIK